MGRPSWADGPPAPAPPPPSHPHPLHCRKAAATAAAAASGDHPDALAASTPPASQRRLDSPTAAALAASAGEPRPPRALSASAAELPHRPAREAALAAAARTPTPTSQPGAYLEEKMPARRRRRRSPAMGNLGSLAACLNRDWRLWGLRKFQVCARSIYGLDFYRRLALTTACRNTSTQAVVNTTRL